MDDVVKLKSAVEDLTRRLQEESAQRMELERRCNLLEKLAYRDPSTGLRTESYLHARVREEIDRAIRFPAATTLLTLCAPPSASESVPRLGQRLTDELRATDQVFKLNQNGLAILLVETSEEGAGHVVARISQDLEQFIKGFGYTVTSFPVDANLADDFLKLALDRHREMSHHIAPEEGGNTQQSSMFH